MCGDLRTHRARSEHRSFFYAHHAIGLVRFLWNYPRRLRLQLMILNERSFSKTATKRMRQNALLTQSQSQNRGAVATGSICAALKDRFHQKPCAASLKI